VGAHCDKLAMVELSGQHLRRLMCRDEKNGKSTEFRVWDMVPDGRILLSLNIPEFSCIGKAEGSLCAENLHLDPFIRFDRTSTCDGQTDGHHIIALYRSVHYDVAAWLGGIALVSINEVTPRRARLVLGWVTVVGRVNHQPLRPTQPPTISWTENECQPKCGDVLWLGGKGRYGSFHL